MLFLTSLQSREEGTRLDCRANEVLAGEGNQAGEEMWESGRAAPLRGWPGGAGEASRPLFPEQCQP